MDQSGVFYFRFSVQAKPVVSLAAPTQISPLAFWYIAAPEL